MKQCDLFAPAFLCLHGSFRCAFFRSGCDIRQCAATLLTLTESFEYACYQGSPAGLMAGPQTFACIAVKVFVKQGQVAPVLGLKKSLLALPGQSPLVVNQKNTAEPLADFQC